MNVGYHHHIPTVIDRRSRVAAHFGVFINELARQAGKVTFFAFETEPSDLEDAELDPSLVRVVGLGRRPPFPIATYAAPRIWKSIRDAMSELDVLVVRGPGPLVPRLMRLPGSLPRAALMMGSWLSWRPNSANTPIEKLLIPWYRRVYEYDQARALRPHLVLTNNAWLRKYFRERGCRDVRQFFASTLTAEMLAVFRSDGQADKRPGRSAGPVRLLYTGRIVEEKGIFDLIECVADLRKRRVDVELSLVGWTPPEDPSDRRAMEVARKLGIEDAIRMRGYLRTGPELARAYKDADVYVFPSRTEWGMPQAVVEAMASGLPVVSTDVEGSRGLLEDGQTALIVTPGDPRGFADRVQLLVEDEALRARVAEQGRRWASKQTNESTVREVLTQLRSIL